MITPVAKVPRECKIAAGRIARAAHNASGLTTGFSTLLLRTLDFDRVKLTALDAK